MDRLYIMGKNDEESSGILAELEAMGARCKTYEENATLYLDPLLRLEVIGLFVGHGRYTSKHLRQFSSEDNAHARGFTLPGFLSRSPQLHLVRLIAVRAPTHDKRLGLIDAIRNLHLKDSSGNWRVPPVKKEKTRTQRTGSCHKEYFDNRYLN